MQHQWSVLERPYLQWTASFRISASGLTDSAIIAKAVFLVRIVAIRLVPGCPTATQRRAIFQTWRIRCCAVDIKVPTHEQRPVVGDVHRIDCVGLLDMRAICELDSQRSGRATQNDIVEVACRLPAARLRVHR